MLAPPDEAGRKESNKMFFIYLGIFAPIFFLTVSIIEFIQSKIYVGDTVELIVAVSVAMVTTEKIWEMIF